MRLFILIRQLSVGGAERQVVCLARALADAGHEVMVAVFYDGGALEADLVGSGVELVRLHKTGRWDIVAFLVRLARAVRRHQPDWIYSFLTGANLVSALLPLRDTRLAWGLRASNMDLRRYDRTARMTARLEARLSARADRIIANSHAGARHAAAIGFPTDRLVVVPNGIDASRFCFDARERERVRRGWAIRENDIAVGVLARLDPMKGHAVLLRALEQLSASTDVRVIFIGSGDPSYRDRLVRSAAEAGLSARVIFAGESSDPVAVLSALDIVCSCSTEGEGFSNTIGEAMACERTCVVSDVGDSARIVGDTGFVVPPGSPEALATAVRRAIEADRDTLGRSARDRVLTNFSVDALAVRTLSALGVSGSGPV